MIRLMCDGLSDKEIALAAGMSRGNVKYFNSNMFKRHGVNSRAQMICKIYKERIAELCPPAPAKVTHAKDTQGQVQAELPSGAQFL